MALSNYDRISQALDFLKSGLRPYMEREFEAQLGPKWPTEVLERMPEHAQERAVRTGEFDVALMLNSMWHNWNDVFKTTLGHEERSLVAELRSVRNRWAHQEPFSTDDTYRALDSMERLLRAVSAPEASDIEKSKTVVLRTRFEKQAQYQATRAGTSTVDGTPVAGLLPWREIITPHPDVARGSFQQAEFAADLDKVFRDQASSEYNDPSQFFARTYLTSGLKNLLVSALKRLSGEGGDPVVELQTNFGGGKTHSMLALYHLFSGISPAELPGADAILEDAGITQLPEVKRAVLVGTALSPGQVHKKDDGTLVHTLWGEMAWQLGGKAGYELLADSDRQGVSPGSAILSQLLRDASPCLILIDEWVTFVRQLYHNATLPAGSFDANMSFAQSLTEAVKTAPRAILVASIPASDIEFGGEGGKEAATRLSNVFGRVEAGWRSATTEESFEIVRRRLFQPIEADKYPLRDATIKKFMELYRASEGDFPPETREADYERRMRAAYPIHPELFARLYSDWCELERFQRTRGVLRLMAKAIHALWRDGDKSLMIMPSTMPLGEGEITSEMTRYLEEQWMPVIEKDVDGERSLPRSLDKDNPTLGRYSATRRVARTLFVGSAPTVNTVNRGLEDRRIKLGCVQPGESVGTFGDALRRLSDAATHLYVDGNRYWFSVQPSVNRLAQDRAAQLDSHLVDEELVRWLNAEKGAQNTLKAIHVAPQSSADVPDETDTRLVILGPIAPHSGRSQASVAQIAVREFLEKRGNAPRRFRNALIFMAPDAMRLAELQTGVRQFMAWKSIESEKEELQLTPFALAQTRSKREEAERTIRLRIPETYKWLLVPQVEGPTPGLPTGIDEYPLSGAEPVLDRAVKRLEREAQVNPAISGSVLLEELRRIPLWRLEVEGNKIAVPVRQLAEDFAAFLYLPRLSSSDVLLDAIQKGVADLSWESRGFAYADSFDAETKTFKGLRAGELVLPGWDGWVVEAEFAARQLEAQRPPTVTPTPEISGATGDAPSTIEPLGTGTHDLGFGTTEVVVTPTPKQPTHWMGSYEITPTRAVSQVEQALKEVINHLASLPGAQVKIHLDIEAYYPNGYSEDTKRTVSENARVMGFKNPEFTGEE